MIAAVALGGLLLASGAAAKANQKSRGEEESIREYQRGVQFLQAGQPDRAAFALERAASLDPDNVLIANGLGLAYLGLQRWPDAERAFRKVLALDRYFTDAHNNLGVVYIQQGRTTQAMDEFRAVLADSRYATPEVARFNIGAMLFDQGKIEEALVHLKAAVLAKPENHEWRYQYGMALKGLGRFQEARDELDTAVKLKGVYPEAMLELAILEKELGNDAAARLLVDRVIDLAPGGELEERARRLLEELEPDPAPRLAR